MSLECQGRTGVDIRACLQRCWTYYQLISIHAKENKDQGDYSNPSGNNRECFGSFGRSRKPELLAIRTMAVDETVLV
jgi:hypothetical protein